MLIATGLIVAALAISPLAARPLVTLPLPLVVNVAVTADLSPSLVDAILAEANDIWRQAGCTFIWQRLATAVVPSARVPETRPYLPARLRVVIGNDPGRPRDTTTPLGWIVFDDDTTPEPEIVLSYANAHKLLVESAGPFNPLERMPRLEQQILLGRAMGRALAHELG